MIVVSACFRAETAWIPPLPDLRVMHTPVGKSAARALESGLNRLLPSTPTLVLSTGFCGGLVPSLHSGKLVLAETIHDGEETIPIDSTLLTSAKDALRASGFDFACGPIESLDRVAQTKEEKQRLQTEGAIAVDMESGPLARWTKERRIRFLSLRAVLDPVEKELPFAAGEPLLRSVLRHPLAALTVVLPVIRAGRAIGRAIPAVASGLKEGLK